MFSYSAKANYPGSPAAAPAAAGSTQCWPLAEFLGGSWGAGGAGCWFLSPLSLGGTGGTSRLCPPPALPFLLLQVLMLADGDSAGFLYRQLPFLSSLERKDGKATAYLCSNFACSLPVTSPQELRGLLCQ